MPWMGVVLMALRKETMAERKDVLGVGDWQGCGWMKVWNEHEQHSHVTLLFMREVEIIISCFQTCNRPSYCGGHSAGFAIVGHAKSVNLAAWNVVMRRLAI
jgi:hypothetical protein